MEESLNLFDDWSDIYDLVYSWKRDDIPFYIEEALKSGGPVLELGCGTGRVTIPIADSGIYIYGMDFSTKMIEMARLKSTLHVKQLSNVNWLVGDMREFSLDQKFSLIIIPFRGFMSLLTIGEQRSCLNCVRDHLEPGGKLILDLFVPDIDLISDVEDTPFHFGDVYDEEGGGKLVVWHQNSFDTYNQINSARSIIEKVTSGGFVEWKKYMDFQIRYSHRFEMQYLAELSGFEIYDLYGNYNKVQFDEQSTEMIWILVPSISE